MEYHLIYFFVKNKENIKNSDKLKNCNFNRENEHAFYASILLSLPLRTIAQMAIVVSCLFLRTRHSFTFDERGLRLATISPIFIFLFIAIPQKKITWQYKTDEDTLLIHLAKYSTQRR